MADIIQLLPDSIANQIAAGEVIQRPASVVKELLENSIDSGATQIKLIIKDSGKTLIQIVDNGCGMSSTDARMSFERHATSKISKAADLFMINTKGFRGEALASIAAIAHVEMITRLHNEDVGTRLLIAGSKVDKQEVVQASPGTSIAVKNLFYNVPARRKFLKSDAVELKNIMTEFHRVALAHPDVFFSLFHNENEVYHLPKGTPKQRIVGIFGKSYNEKLLPVDEITSDISIQGFVGKAEAAKKSTGEQYFFVNDRFIKSNYLNHAVKSAFDQLLQEKQYPTFFIYLQLDPAKIDINVHPTKTEIKFDEERIIYNHIRVSVKHALGKYIVTPTFDFDTDTNFLQKNSAPAVDQSYQSAPSKATSTPLAGKKEMSQLEKDNLSSWQNVYADLRAKAEQPKEKPQALTLESDIEIHDDKPLQSSGRDPYQIHSSYIVSHMKSGYILIDQKHAHQRILYEQTLSAMEGQQRPVQKELFTQTVSFDPSTAVVVKEILPKINQMGFEVAEFGSNEFVIHGLPAGLPTGTNGKELLEKVIDQYMSNVDLKLEVDESIARSYALSASINRGRPLTIVEMKEIVDKLFACETPYQTPSGKKTFLSYDLDELRKQF